MSDTKDWRRICADCREGKPPKDCEYYGEPRGCNAPTYGGPPPRYYDELREENARLHAALKPVLDIVIDRNTSDLSMAIAIKEAKRIYNEGEAKQKEGGEK